MMSWYILKCTSIIREGKYPFLRIKNISIYSIFYELSVHCPRLSFCQGNLQNSGNFEVSAIDISYELQILWHLCLCFGTYGVCMFLYVLPATHYSFYVIRYVRVSFVGWFYFFMDYWLHIMLGKASSNLNIIIKVFSTIFTFILFIILLLFFL